MDFEDPPKPMMIQKHFQMEMWSLMNQVCCGHKVISNYDMKYDDSRVLMIPKCSNDKRLFQMRVMTLIIQNIARIANAVQVFICLLVPRVTL